MEGINYQTYLNIAKKEFDETGSMTQGRACILLNCRPARDYINWKCRDTVAQDVITRALDIIKIAEKQMGDGKYLNYKYMAASVIYLALKMKHGNKRDMDGKSFASYEIVNKIFGHELKVMTIRRHVKMIIKRLDY